MFISNHLICWFALKNYAKRSFSRLKMLVIHVCYMITRKSRNFHAFTQAYLAHAQTNFPAAVNEKIKSIITPKYDVTFIDNSSLDKTSLNGSKLHLNAKGSAILASHFISFIKGGQSLRHSPRRSRRDFQMDTMNQLQELLKLISCMNRLTTR